jgi:predicted peroxiredoxin
MATLLFVGTNGSEDPTKAVLPFLSANGAIEAGHQAQIALLGDAVVLMRTVVADAVTPVGWPPLKDMLATNIEHAVPIYV